jgi:hypothetical protein
MKWIAKNFPGAILHNQKAVAKQIPIRGEMRWISQRNDIFGCIDIIALIPDGYTLPVPFRSQALFIQCTMSDNITGKERELKAIDWPLSICDVQIWQKMDAGRVRILGLNQDRKFVSIAEIIRGKLVLPGTDPF